MSELRLREDLNAIPDYKPGKATTQSPNTGPVFKVSSNENPYGPLPSVATAIADRIAHINRYPDTAATAVVALLCERFQVSPVNLVLGSGSVEVVSQLMRATACEGNEVMFAWRSFEAYPMLVRAAGATPVAVPLTADHRHDLDAMRAAITARTRLILVCNPNNPTGTTIGTDELTAFLDAVPADITVVIDEAYVHFNERTDSPSGIEYFRRYPNVAVAHTFSKAYGLAGLRIGYAIAPERLTNTLRKVAIPFGVTDLAQAAAVASLHAEDELSARVADLIAERERVVGAFRDAGIDLPETQANFIWVPFGDATTAAAQLLESHGLLVRPFAGEGFRVTIAEREANNLLVRLAPKLAAHFAPLAVV
ncbi:MULTISPECIES: histidinol-phosphate transaminase [unclassified Microbacterium]|uniref:histidinol-phosphate transaminase n=1 Tax=unclassified Microbacterium TaxID=2609290 RepID=UPI000EA93555|nr:MULTISPECIES: histidinol-phosphate transaminase [unclassified Microbacterium]MBT2486418.1 histidinol-phosphate transaminase [Microbacterium sp. ISL-108]RKN69119.1 histidinol-phosphate transaminase [Microbacterium sp. CGR2]